VPEFLLGQFYTDGTVFDQELRALAERIYAHVRARDTVRVQAEVEVLIANIKRAIMVWEGAGCNALAATAGYSIPAGVTLVDASPVTFAAGAGAPLNPSL